MIINIAHIVHISHLSQPKRFTWGSGDQNPNENAFRSTTLAVKTRAADPHSFFRGYGSGSSCSSQCGSGSICFFNAGSDTGPA